MKIRSGFTDKKNGNVWYWDAELSFPCILNLKTGKTEIRGCDVYFDGYQIFDVEGEFYFTSHADWAVMKYDPESETGYKYVFEGQREEKWFHSYTFQLGKKLYMVPLQIIKYPIICFDTESKLFSTDDGLMNKTEKMKNETEWNCMFPIMREGIVWSAFAGSNCYFSYSLLTGEFHEYFVQEGISLYTMCCDEKMVCLVQSDASEIVIQYGNQEKCIPTMEEECSEKVYSRVIRLQSFFAVIPMNGRNLVLIDAESTQIHVIPVYPETEDNHGRSRVKDCVEDEDWIYLLPWGAEGIYSVHKKTFAVQKVVVAYDEKQYIAMRMQRVYDARKRTGKVKSPAIYENDNNCSLEAFCTYIVYQRKHWKTENGNINTVGHNIQKNITERNSGIGGTV